jgi:hypothetical protein
MCNCNFDSQLAYIIKKTDDNIDYNKTITINDYLKDNKLQQKIKKDKRLIVCSKKNELIKYESENRRSHFKHKIFQDNKMTEWHRDWQNQFDIDKQEISIGNRRADVCINNYVIEFQYSKSKFINIEPLGKGAFSQVFKVMILIILLKFKGINRINWGNCCN